MRDSWRQSCNTYGVVRARVAASAIVLTWVCAVYGPAAASSSTKSDNKQAADYRAMAIAQAQVWAPTDIPTLDIMTGPEDPRAFPFRANVNCDYEEKKSAGQSPK